MTDTATAFDFEQARFNMIEQQIRPWEVLDQKVLDVIARVPREDFVPERYRSSLAFTDISIPIGHGQSMLPPKLEGRILQSLNVQPSDRILEIGTGNGYLTACLAKLGDEVVSIEIHADLSEAAQTRAQAHGIKNIHFIVDDAAAGWPEREGFDVIAVTGSLPQLHHGFHHCLKIGGRLFVVVGRPPVMEALLITRVGKDQWAEESLFDTSIPALENAEKPDGFRF